MKLAAAMTDRQRVRQAMLRACFAHTKSLSLVRGMQEDLRGR